MNPKPRLYVRSGFVMAHVVNPVLRRLGWTLVLIVAGGSETHRVRNMRAAGRGQIRFQGATTPLRAVEIDGPERDRIVAAYRAKQGRTVEGFFRELPEPADHPVFRVEPAG